MTAFRYKDIVNLQDTPLAGHGLTSYRCRSPYCGWIMIGARNAIDAMVEARRSNESVKAADLQFWNGTAYAPCNITAASGVTT